MSYSINIKQSGAGETFAIQVSDDTTVAQLKVLCTEVKTEYECDKITLVYKGRILKDEQTAGEIKLAEGQTMHMVYKAAQKKVDAPAPAGGSSSSTFASPGSASQAPLNPMGGMAGFGGFPGMMSGGGLSGMGGLNMDPNGISAMMQNPMMRGMLDNML